MSFNKTLILLSLPLFVQTALMLFVYFASDSTLEAVLNEAKIDWFTWPSVHLISDVYGETLYDRIRLCAGIGIVMTIASTIYLIVFFGRRASVADLATLSNKSTLISIGFCAVIAFVIFLNPESYVVNHGVYFVALPPNFFGVTALSILAYGFAFFSVMPILKVVGVTLAALGMSSAKN